MISIFKDDEEKRKQQSMALQKEWDAIAGKYEKLHQEKLEMLGITEEEWQKQQEKANRKNKVKGIVGFIFLALIILAPTLIFGSMFLYKTFRPVDDIQVYVTYDGYCYHKDRNCFELKGHNVRGVNLDDVKNQKRPCDICCK